MADATDSVVRGATDAFLVQFAPPGPGLGTRHALYEGPSRGRPDGPRALRTDDPSLAGLVRFLREDGGVRASAVRGSRIVVNGIEVNSGRLAAGDALAVGGRCYLFLPADGVSRGNLLEKAYLLSHHPD